MRFQDSVVAQARVHPNVNAEIGSLGQLGVLSGAKQTLRGLGFYENFTLGESRSLRRFLRLARFGSSKKR